MVHGSSWFHFQGIIHPEPLRYESAATISDTIGQESVIRHLEKAHHSETERTHRRDKNKKVPKQG